MHIKNSDQTTNYRDVSCNETSTIIYKLAAQFNCLNTPNTAFNNKQSINFIREFGDVKSNALLCRFIL